MDKDLQQKLTEAGQEILDKIGVQSQMKYFKMGGEVSSILSIRTGDLVRAVLGKSEAKIRDIAVGEDQAVFSIGVKRGNKPMGVPYAALHELGGVRTVTPKMRKFFWGKFFETSVGDKAYHRGTESAKWWGLAHAKQLVFPARPFLQPAITDSMPAIKEILQKKVGEYLSLTVTKIVTGAQKAYPLRTG